MIERKKICIIYTGGTIGMIASKNGYIPSKSDFAETIQSIRDLNLPGMPELTVVQFDPLLDSSNMAENEWNKIGAEIASRYYDYDGFVVLHGTDTMAYSASALSFMMENLNKPIIFTGSQIPLCEIRSDGFGNIVSAVVIASTGIIREVCIYFDGKLIRGCRSTKYSSNRFAAFASPNCDVLAEVGISVDYKSVSGCPSPVGEFHFVPFLPVPVGIIKMFPGIQIKIFESIMTKELRGVVLETFGAGNIPSDSTGHLIPMIERAYQNGTVVVVCSQCIQGTVSLGTYETSKSLIDIGAVNGRDMTTEAAMTKLLYLFSKGFSLEEIKTQMSVNLRGELS